MGDDGMTGPAQQTKSGDAVAALDAITVRYGPTMAVDGVSLALAPGEILGLAGANGAGKSTLMRVLSGMTRPTAGVLRVGGAPVPDAYDARAAQAAGVRTVWQELSLCPNLTVAENFYIEQPRAYPAALGWRAAYGTRAAAALGEVFPGAAIDATALTGDLPIAQRQMVEIARAASSPGLRLLILDEPTSSLDVTASQQLRAHIRRLAARGVTVVFITHKLAEIVDVATRAMVMRNGQKVVDAGAGAVTEAALIAAMGGVAADTGLQAGRTAGDGPERLHLSAPWTETPLALRGGTIVGIAGLEGSGQSALLRAVFEGGAGAARRGTVAHVSGDRAREGVFALFDVLSNVAAGRIAGRAALSPVRRADERAAAVPLAQAVTLDPDRLGSPIGELSGGNQQKALFARALAMGADILLLDDPTRGVDIATKRQIYATIRDLADRGALILWHSTEDREFAECDRVLLLSGHRIRRDLAADQTGEDNVLEAAFAARAEEEPRTERAGAPRRIAATVLRNAAFVALVVILGVMMQRNPMVASEFGLRLLLGPAVPLMFVAFAQMFVVGGSQIDLGVGAFAGLVNVLAVTVLYTSPLWGAVAILAALAVYVAMAPAITEARIPAIVVTLGASFVWYGTGYMILPAPGGTAPDWLRALTAWRIPGVPTPLVLILGATALAVAIHRARFGTVLRGMGANEAVMARSGWSVARWTMARYLVAGGFAAAAGLYVAASSGAGDVNAGGTYTLLSVASVVLGGCALLGGVIRPVGVAAGVVTLSLIGALLGSLGVSTDWNAAVQGALMIAVLGLGAVVARRGDGP